MPTVLSKTNGEMVQVLMMELVCRTLRIKLFICMCMLVCTLKCYYVVHVHVCIFVIIAHISIAHVRFESCWKMIATCPCTTGKRFSLQRCSIVTNTPFFADIVTPYLLDNENKTL